MDYSWINSPFIDGIVYFTSMFGYFLHQAQKMGSILGLLGIIWYCFQLWTSTTTVRKAIVGIIMKFALFILILNIYYPTIMGIRGLVTTWGRNAGGAVGKIEEDLAKFKNHLDSLVALEEEELSAAEEDLADAIMELNALSPPETPSSFASVSARTFEERENWDIAVRRKAAAEAILENRKRNESKSKRTLLALMEVLKPRDLTGTRSEAVTKYYFLDLDLKSPNGVSTGFLSPSAILRVSLFVAEVMLQKENMQILNNMEDAQNEKNWWNAGKHILWANLSITDVFNWFLTALCCVGIVLGTVFALIQYVMCIFEYTIITSVAIVFVPMLLFDGTKDMANKIMPALLGLSIKLLVITLCMFFATYMFCDLAMKQIGENTGVNLATLGYVAFTIVLAFVVTQNAPQIAVTMLTGNPQLSMGEVVQAATTAASTGAMGYMLGKRAVGTGVGAGIAGASNTAGFFAEAKAASSAAFQKTKQQGSSGDEAQDASYRALGKVISGRAQQGFKSMLHKAGHTGMDKSGGGLPRMGNFFSSPFGGGSTDNMINRFALNASSKLSEANKNDPTVNGRYNKDSYRNARSDSGVPLTMNEYLAEMREKGEGIGSSLYTPKKNANSTNTPSSNVQYAGPELPTSS